MSASIIPLNGSSKLTLVLWVLKWPQASCPLRTGHCTCPLCTFYCLTLTAHCSGCKPHLINSRFHVSTSFSPNSFFSIHVLHVQQNINPPCGCLAGAVVANNSTNLTGQFGWNLPSGKTSLIYPRLNHNFSLVACSLISELLAQWKTMICCNDLLFLWELQKGWWLIWILP